MKKPTLTIGIGHDNPLNGQTGTGGELELLKKVYFAIQPRLIAAGVELYYDDAEVKNATFTDYAIFPHFDGSSNPDYNGGFIDAGELPSATKDQDWKFAQTIADYYFSAMGIRFAPEHRTINTKRYYAFNQTGENTKQFLIELGTLTNVNDRAKLQDYNKIAELLTQGIISYLSQYDANFQSGTNQTTVDGLRQELKKKKEFIEQLQQSHKQDLADIALLCQQKIQTIKQKLLEIINFI